MLYPVILTMSVAAPFGACASEEGVGYQHCCRHSQMLVCR